MIGLRKVVSGKQSEDSHSKILKHIRIYILYIYIYIAYIYILYMQAAKLGKKRGEINSWDIKIIFKNSSGAHDYFPISVQVPVGRNAFTFLVSLSMT